MKPKAPFDFGSLPADRFLRRGDVPAYLAWRYGVRFAKSRFDKFVSEGGGPQYTLMGRKAFYRIAWIDDWFAAEVKRKLQTPGRRKATEKAPGRRSPARPKTPQG
jgi:hypothetical protein